MLTPIVFAYLQGNIANYKQKPFQENHLMGNLFWPLGQDMPLRTPPPAQMPSTDPQPPNLFPPPQQLNSQRCWFIQYLYPPTRNHKTKNPQKERQPRNQTPKAKLPTHKKSKKSDKDQPNLGPL